MQIGLIGCYYFFQYFLIFMFSQLMQVRFEFEQLKQPLERRHVANQIYPWKMEILEICDSSLLVTVSNVLRRHSWNKSGVMSVHPQRRSFDRYFVDSRLAKRECTARNIESVPGGSTRGPGSMTGQIALSMLNKNRSQLYLWLAIE
jgi:hypothetical protein